jgi:hypothetical protein
MSRNELQNALTVVVADLRQRWRPGVPRDDPYKLGFNAGLWNALSLIEEAVEDAGVDPSDIGMEKVWSDRT